MAAFYTDTMGVVSALFTKFMKLVSGKSAYPIALNAKWADNTHFLLHNE